MRHTVAAAVRVAARRALVAAAALLAAGTAPAQAAAAHTAPGDWLYLTVTRADTRPPLDHAGTRPPFGHGDARSAPTRATLLLCDPPQGHRHAAEACAQLAAAGGDIARIPHRDVFCSMVYAPVTVHARGEWSGRPVDFTRTYANPCVMIARTGDVFRLDGTDHDHRGQGAARPPRLRP
jgi:hypothetical protein